MVIKNAIPVLSYKIAVIGHYILQTCIRIFDIIMLCVYRINNITLHMYNLYYRAYITY